MIKNFLKKIVLMFLPVLGRTKANLIRIKLDHLSYLSLLDLTNLHKAVKNIEQEGVPGSFVEAGCALGGSGIAISLAKARSREFFVYDMFGMIPAPSDRDAEDVHARYNQIVSGQARGIGQDTYYGYISNLKQVVEKNFNAFDLDLKEENISLIEGDFKDTMNVDGPVAFAHIDCDWYDSVMICLKQLVPNLSVGGVMVLDDYHIWSGCRQAVDDFFVDKKDSFTFSTNNSKLYIKRVS